jgi:hypothetical protein
MANPGFFVRAPANRSAWIPSDTAPDRWERMVALDVPVLVHGKLGGRFKKDVEGVAHAISKDHLLVSVDYAKFAHLDAHAYGRKLVPGLDLDDAGRLWINLYDFSGCTEGYRFKRSIVKLFKVLASLVRESKKNRKTAEKLAAIEAERGHREGYCSVCYGSFIADHADGVVMHGYTRPGDGCIYGSCPGVGFPCLEVSPDGAVNYLENILRPTLAKAEKNLAAVDTLDTVVVPTYGRKITTVNRGEVGFEKAVEALRFRLEGDVKALKQDVAMFVRRVAEWAPQKWPRKEAPGASS